MSPADCPPFLTRGELQPLDAFVERCEGDSTREPLSRLAKCATDLVVAATGIDLSGLATFDPSGSANMVAASRHRSDSWEHLVVPPGDGVASRVLERGGSVTVKNYEAESGSSTHLIEVFAHSEAAYSMLAVPIFSGSSVVGVLYGGLRRPEYIGDRGRVGLHNVAKLFAAVLAAEEPSHPIDQIPTPSSAKEVHAGLVAALSARERKVLKLLGDGLSTRDIAAAEFLAVNTVRSYIQSALWKLGAHSRLQAVALARELGLLA